MNFLDFSSAKNQAPHAVAELLKSPQLCLSNKLILYASFKFLLVSQHTEQPEWSDSIIHRQLYRSNPPASALTLPAGAAGRDGGPAASPVDSPGPSEKRALQGFEMWHPE